MLRLKICQTRVSWTLSLAQVSASIISKQETGNTACPDDYHTRIESWKLISLVSMTCAPPHLLETSGTWNHAVQSITKTGSIKSLPDSPAFSIPVTGRTTLHELKKHCAHAKHGDSNLMCRWATSQTSGEELICAVGGWVQAGIRIVQHRLRLEIFSKSPYG